MIGNKNIYSVKSHICLNNYQKAWIWFFFKKKRKKERKTYLCQIIMEKVAMNFARFVDLVIG